MRGRGWPTFKRRSLKLQAVHKERFDLPSDMRNWFVNGESFKTLTDTRFRDTVTDSGTNAPCFPSPCSPKVQPALLSSSPAQRILLLKHLSSSKRPMLACEAYSFRGVPLCSVPPDFSYGPPAPKLNSKWRLENRLRKVAQSCVYHLHKQSQLCGFVVWYKPFLPQPFFPHLSRWLPSKSTKNHRTVWAKNWRMFFKVGPQTFTTFALNT